jgi:hypothetical protein
VSADLVEPGSPHWAEFPRDARGNPAHLLDAFLAKAGDPLGARRFDSAALLGESSKIDRQGAAGDRAEPRIGMALGHPTE